MLGIGVLSYSLYLWHWSVLSVSRWTVGVTATTAPFLLLAIVALAVAAYRWIERPLRSAPWSTSQGRTLAYGLAASVAAACVLLVLRSDAGAPLARLGDRLLPVAYEPPGLLHESLPCHLPKLVETSLADCLGTTDASKRTIYIIGDSHATNHVPSVERAIANRDDLQVRYLSESGFLIDVSGVGSCTGVSSCLEGGYQKQLTFLADALRAGDVVVFSWSRERVLRAGAFPKRPDNAALRRLAVKLTEVRDVVLSARATLVLVEDIPRPCADHVAFLIGALRQGNLGSCTVTATDSRMEREPLSRVYRSVVRKGVVLFDPHDYLCVRGVCGLLLEGSDDLLYGDASPHFSLKHSTPLWEPWRDFLARLVPAT